MLRQLNQEMIRNLQWPETGLLPSVVIDSELPRSDQNLGGLLMLAYVNQEALAMTQIIGKAVFWSRSRAGLWVKGESSGNVMPMRGLYTDCDLDVVVYDVRAPRSTCHNDTFSCFELPAIGEYNQ